MNKEQIDLLRELGAVQENICNCGSCKEAAEAGIRQVEQLLENQCPIWVWQIGFILMKLGATAIHEQSGKEAMVALVAVGPVSLDAALTEIAEERKRKNAH